MKKVLWTGTALVAALLSGCGAVARQAADNREVGALPLGGQEFGGGLQEAGPPVRTQGRQPQGIQPTPISYATSSNLGPLAFDDLDVSALPGIVGTPSGLDVPLAFATANFTACGTAAPSVGVTVTGVSLKVSDAAHPAGASVAKTGLALKLLLTRSGDSYSVSHHGGAGATFATLFADWGGFAPIVVKTGANTPNTLSAKVDILTD